MVPSHDVVSKYGVALAKTIINAYILTGDDCLCKVGTNHAAVGWDPVQFLTNFGENVVPSKQDQSLAEKYLVHVWAGARSTTSCETFDHLRMETSTSNKHGNKRAYSPRCFPGLQGMQFVVRN